MKCGAVAHVEAREEGAPEGGGLEREIVRRRPRPVPILVGLMNDKVLILNY